MKKNRTFSLKISTKLTPLPFLHKTNLGLETRQYNVNLNTNTANLYENTVNTAYLGGTRYHRG